MKGMMRTKDETIERDVGTYLWAVSWRVQVPGRRRRRRLWAWEVKRRTKAVRMRMKGEGGREERMGRTISVQGLRMRRLSGEA